MKKLRLLSFILACLTVLSIVPTFSLFATAAAVDPATAPTVLPDGNTVDKIEIANVSWAEKGPSNSAATQNKTDASCTMKTNDTISFVSNNHWNRSWRGASGIMVYITAADATKDFNFALTIHTNSNRPSSATANSNVIFTSAPNANGTQGNGKTSTAYYYDGNKWNEIITDSQYLTGAGNGWYYVPFTSYWYQGGGATGYIYNDGVDDPAKGLNLLEFMARFDAQNIMSWGMKSGTAESNNVTFSDFYHVYENEMPSEDAATGSLFDNIATNSVSKTTSDGNGSFTVKNITNSGNGIATVDWLSDTENTAANLAGATAIKFHIDTTKLSDGETLELRLRFRITSSYSDFLAQNKSFMFAQNSLGYVTSDTATSWMSVVCSDTNSKAYCVDDKTGEIFTRFVNSNVKDNITYDYFEALPQGFSGDIYIPLSNFNMDGGKNERQIPLTTVLALTNFVPTQIGIAHNVSGDTDNTNEVTYSNFEVVYGNTSFDGASVTLTNNFEVNFYANVQEGATNAKMSFTVGNKNSVDTEGELQTDGTYKFTCKDILPQSIVDTITATLTATINGKTASSTIEYSIREYAKNKLAAADTSAELKTLLVDLLYYGASAQTTSGYKTDDLATNILSEEQKNLRSADKTDDITATAVKSGEENAAYAWDSATLRLENTMAVKLVFKASSLDGLTVEVKTGNRTPVVFDADSISSNGDGTYYVIFNDIGATEYDTEITAVIKQDGTQIGQTLTYSVAAYIAQASANTELLRNLYSYGKSAVAYVASLDA